MNPSTTPNVLDIASLGALKRQVRANDAQGARAAAQQFEALFLQQVLKSMRDATPQDGAFDSDQTRMYQSLLDQQLAQVLATRSNGTGLAAMLEKQLTRLSAEPQSFPDGLPLHPQQAPLPLQQKAWPLSPSAAPVPTPSPPAAAGGRRSEFVRSILPHAEAAGRALGIPGRFVAAQAALESGWGKAEPRGADGQPSYNLFGIKAGRGWSGPVVEATTTEYRDGSAQKRVEKFRAYASYAEAFRDYASLIANNPRYAAVLGSGSAGDFARGLQQAGYASDPQYAAKLERIIGGARLRDTQSA